MSVGRAALVALATFVPMLAGCARRSGTTSRATADSSAPRAAPRGSASDAGASAADDAHTCADALRAPATRAAACDDACADSIAIACVTLAELEVKAPKGPETDARVASAYDRGCALGAAPACAAFSALVERVRAACSPTDPAACAHHGALVTSALAPSDAALARADASLKLACDAKLGEACELRGDLLAAAKTPSAARDVATLDAYATACDAGRAHACCAEARMIETGVGTTADPARADAYYERAWKAGQASCLSEAEARTRGSKLDVRALAELRASGRHLRPTRPSVRFDVGTRAPATAPVDADKQLSMSKWRFLDCARDALGEDASAGGTVRVTVKLDAEGRVLAASASGGRPSSLARCVRHESERISLGAPGDGATTLTFTVTIAQRR